MRSRLPSFVIPGLLLVLSLCWFCTEQDAINNGWRKSEYSYRYCNNALEK